MVALLYVCTQLSSSISQAFDCCGDCPTWELFSLLTMDKYPHIDLISPTSGISSYDSHG